MLIFQVLITTLSDQFPKSIGSLEFSTEERRAIRFAAQRNIRAAAPVRTRYGRNHIFVSFSQGSALTVRMPRYMWYQNNGIRPFVMWWAEGRTIPLRMADGTVIYRRATRVGEITSTRDESGRFTGSRRRWSHPGLRPKRFVQKGLSRTSRQVAISTAKASMREAISYVNKGVQNEY